MPRVLSHEMCRMRMCCCCGVKLKSPKSMSARLEELVKQWGPDPGFDSQISSYPTGICSTCQRDIYKVKQGKPEAAWLGPKPPAWSDFSANRMHGVRKCGIILDTSEEPSMCDICTHVRGLGTGARGLKIGPQSHKFVPRDKATLYDSKDDNKRSWCQKCAQPTGPGLSHPCNPIARKKNILKLIEKQSQKEKEAIVGMSLHNIVKVENKHKVQLRGVGGNKSKLMVSLGKKLVNVPKIEVSTFKKVEKEMDISRTQTLSLKKILNTDVVVEKGVRRLLREWDHMADDQLILHRLDDLELKVSAVPVQKNKDGEVIKDGVPAHIEPITRDVLVVKDVAEHFKWVIEKRGLQDTPVKFKIYIDSGEGSFKVLASVINEHQDPEIMDTTVEQPNNMLSGVNRVLVLAYVEEIQETYNNLRKILELLNFKDLKFKVCGDLKIVNVILGLSGHGGKYSCAFCYGECNLVAGPVCTFRHLKDQYNMYLEAGYPVNKMQQFYNVVHPCLLNISNLDDPISTVISHPELHYLMGVTNWIFKLVNKILGTNKFGEL